MKALKEYDLVTSELLKLVVHAPQSECPTDESNKFFKVG